MLTNSIWGDIKYYVLYGDMVIKLIIANIAVYVLGLVLWVVANVAHSSVAAHFLDIYLTVPPSFVLWIKQPWSLFTYMFYHNNIWHIASNLIMLYWAGGLFAVYMTHEKVLWMYLFGGIVGGLVYLCCGTFIPQISIGNPLAGASASVLAMLFATVSINPDHEVYVFRNGPFKLKYIAGVLGLAYIISAFSNASNRGGGIAHIGGILAGVAYVKAYHSGLDLLKPFSLVGNLFKRKPVVRLTHKSEIRTVVSKPAPSNKVQDRLDAILDKMNESGYDSLNKEEKDFLFRYSDEK